MYMKLKQCFTIKVTFKNVLFQVPNNFDSCYTLKMNDKEGSATKKATLFRFECPRSEMTSYGSFRWPTADKPYRSRSFPGGWMRAAISALKSGISWYKIENKESCRSTDSTFQCRYCSALSPPLIIPYKLWPNAGIVLLSTIPLH